MKRTTAFAALLAAAALVFAGVASATVDTSVYPWGWATSSNGTRCGAAGAAGPCVVVAYNASRGVSHSDSIHSYTGTCTSPTGQHRYNWGAAPGGCLDFNPANVLYFSGSGGNTIQVWVRETCPMGGYAWSPKGTSSITGGIGNYYQYFGEYVVQKPAGGCQP
jgi:hypothetical protein